MDTMKTLTINGQKFQITDEGALRFDKPQELLPEEQAQAQDNLGLDQEMSDHSVYFDIDYDGVVSLKPEYRGLGSDKTTTNSSGETVYMYPYGISDNGVNKNGSKINELPEVLVIPDVINGIEVSALAEAMFNWNCRVKSLTIPLYVSSIPTYFANKAYELEAVNGTENIEAIGQAAFQMCGIKKAIFPSLKQFNGAAHFNNAANLSIADIGDTVTTIPQNCFAYCDRLAIVRGGASVTSIGVRAFYATRSLQSLSFLNNVKSIGAEAFVLTSVHFDWWTFSGCTFETNATPAQYNASEWWNGCTYTACKKPLGSTFNQINPEWANIQIPNSADTYGKGCMEVSAAHIYSALKGEYFGSPRYFVETIVGGIDNGALLVPTATESDGIAYGVEDIIKWFEALDLECESVGYNNQNLKKVYDALADGAMILTHVNPNHAAVIYGIADNGDLLVLDSCGYNSYIEDYTARTYKQPIWGLALAGDYAIIVKTKGG